MLDKYIQLNRAIRSIAATVREGMDARVVEGEGYATATVGNLLLRDISDLQHLWPEELDDSVLKDLKTQSTKMDNNAFRLIADVIVPQIEDLLDSFFARQPVGDIGTSVLDLLHPAIITCSYSQYRAGNYRDAVLNAFLTVFDLIRRRTGIDKDGIELVGEAFSLGNPKLVFSSLATESGKNEQKGYMQILQGAYQGIRNPKAHSLELQPDKRVAAQNLVFASILYRKVEAARTMT